MYEQSLVKVIKDHIKPKVLKRNNRYKKWEYGYDVENNIIVISRDGTIGDVIEIQNLKIALPAEPDNVYVCSKKEERWARTEYPKQLSKIKNVFEWEQYPIDFKETWYDYIDEEFRRREEGFWFKNKGVSTYITGSHYMFLQWSKIDVGAADYRESNRLFYIFWEACKADQRCYGMCYLKNRSSGFSFMASSELVNQATISSDSRFGILSKSGADAKKMFTDKVVPISINYPFFFKPIQDGMDRPKTELAYRVPASKLTRRKLDQGEAPEELEGLDTTIDWKNTLVFFVGTEGQLHPLGSERRRPQGALLHARRAESAQGRHQSHHRQGVRAVPEDQGEHGVQAVGLHALPLDLLLLRKVPTRGLGAAQAGLQEVQKGRSPGAQDSSEGGST